MRAARPRATLRLLIRLYPRAWRQRYADEMSVMLSTVPLTPASILDLVAGAIDAHVAPQPIRSSNPATPSDREDSMFTNLMKRCSVGPDVTAEDKRLGSAVLLGLTLVFAVAYVIAARTYRGNELVDAFGVMAFPAALFLSMPFTYLKGHSRISQIIIVGGSLLLLAGMSIVATRI